MTAVRGWIAAAVLGFVLAFAQMASAVTLTVSWDAPADATVMGYLVSYGTASGVYTTSVDVGNVTSYQPPGLVANTPYYFVVQSYDSDGMLSGYSSEASYQPLTLACHSASGISNDGNPVAVTITLPDASGGLGTITGPSCSPPSGSLFSIGTSTSTCSATDSIGTASCQSQVTVALAAPTISVNGSSSGTVNASVGGVLTIATSDLQPHATDWIAIAPSGGAATDYSIWSYLNGQKTAPASGLASATFTVPVPGTPGTYEARFFSTNGFTRLATGPQIQVGTPTITVNSSSTAISVAPSATVTAAWTNGPNNQLDWIELVQHGASASASPLQWVYLSGGTNSASAVATPSGSHAFTAPATGGTYEVRLLSNNSYTAVATSAIVTVTPPAPTVTVNSQSSGTVNVTAGNNVTIAIANDPANTTDWITIAAVGSADNSYPVWRYLNGQMTPPGSGLSSASLSVPVPSTPGTYEVRLFASNGFTRLATGGAQIQVAAAAATALTVNASSSPITVAAGATLTAAWTNGPGNALDWIALAPHGSATSADVPWQYLSGGNTAGSAVATPNGNVTFTAPTTAGTYEVRLLSNNSFNVVATSATITVGAVLTVNSQSSGTVSVAPGASVTIGVSGGPGNATDWVTVAPVGSSDATYPVWRYLNGQLTAPGTGISSGSFSMPVPSTPGTYEIRLFASNSFTRVGTAVAQVQVTGTTLTANSSSSPISVTRGTSITAAWTNGPGNALDWVALAAVGAPASSILQWKYLSGGTAAGSAVATPSGNLTLTAPNTSGTYEIRLYSNNSYTVVVTSPTITVP